MKLDDKEHQGIIINFSLMQMSNNIKEIMDAFSKYAKTYKKLHFAIADLGNETIEEEMLKHCEGGRVFFRYLFLLNYHKLFPLRSDLAFVTIFYFSQNLITLARFRVKDN